MNLTAVQLGYALAFGLAATVCFAAAGWVHTRYDVRGTEPFVWTFTTIGVYAAVSAGHVLFAASRTVSATAAALELSLGAAAAVGWFAFAVQYTDRPRLWSRPVRVVLVGFVGLAGILTLTNGVHGLVYPSLTPVAAPFDHYQATKGPGHYLVTGLSYVPFAAGTWLLVRLLYETRYLSRAIVSLLLGALALVGANAVPYLAAVPIDHNPLYMPLGATLFGVGVVVALHYDLFAVTPVARRSVVTAIRDPIVTVDKEGRIVDVNPAFTAVFGGGRRAQSLVYEPFDAVAPRVADGVDLGGPENQSVRVEEGREARHYTVSVSTVESGAHTLGHTLVFRDVTEAVESRRELERQNEQLDTFARTAAHNLRNPLGTISGFADVLDAHLKSVNEGTSRYDPELVEQCLDRITTQTSRMDDIVADFLRVMRDSKTVTAFEPVDIVDAFDSARSLLETERLTITVEGPGLVYADRWRFSLLLRSVLQSALDRADGAVTVRARVTEDGLMVRDDAGALPPEDCEMLLEHGRASHYDVTGLGLVVAQTLARVHHWEVAAEPAERGLSVVLTGAETAPEAIPRQREAAS
jgi:PAS domain S-box-containing protein